jgi:hypothetical protein
MARPDPGPTFGGTVISSGIYGGVPNKPNGLPGILDLAQTIAHEDLHRTQESWYRRMGPENPAIEDESGRFITENFQKILDCIKGCGD